MAYVQFIRIKKLTGSNIVEVASRHNHREILAEIGPMGMGHIDPSKIRLNRVLRGSNTAAEVAANAKTLMREAGVVSLRKDAVRALEIVIGLPPNSGIDEARFFSDATEWVERHFGALVLSAIVHNDESAPHCHVLLLPLVGGRMIGSDLMGGPAKLKSLQAAFHTELSQKYGLVRQEAQQPSSAAMRSKAIAMAYTCLEANSGLSTAVLRALLAPHLANPEPLILALNLSMPAAAPTVSTVVKLMTKACKPKNP
jgi:hypothetical protein